MNPRTCILSKLTIIELYATLFQVERAVDSLSPFHWPRLKSYYDEQTTKSLQTTLQMVKQQLRDAKHCLDCVPCPFSWVPPQEPSLFRKIINGLRDIYFEFVVPVVNRWKSHWAFPVPELMFIVDRLQSFLNILHLHSCPDRDVLMRLRMELTGYRTLLEGRCYGLKEIKLAQCVEYYNKAALLKTISLSDIIGRKALRAG